MSSSSFLPVQSRRLFEDVCDQIRAQIADGALGPGDKLPAERDLAAQFGISRTAVREALRSLEFAGLIELKKGAHGGAFVLGRDMGLVLPFQSILDVGHLSLRELTDARIEIQDVVVRLACSHATQENLDALDADIQQPRQHLQQGTAGTDPSATQNFYSLLAEATGNRVLVVLVKALSQMVYQAIHPLHRPLNFDLVSVRSRFVECMRSRDVEGAQQIMRNYLEFLHQHIVAEDANRDQAAR
ncbi:MAG: GntR family transcriptional regulator [Hyphomonadaceae bacterium]|nr:GntR family transcriptional regulator [Hyphomonadaceae bacterium]